MNVYIALMSQTEMYFITYMLVVALSSQEGQGPPTPSAVKFASQAFSPDVSNHFCHKLFHREQFLQLSF